MKVQNLWRQFPLQILFLSWGGAGFLPKAPGTWGTFFAIPLIFLFSTLALNQLAVSIINFFIIVLSILITQKLQNKLKLHDPQWIVIDEVAGFSITWSFLNIFNFKIVLASFILFRIFDIIKIWPASFFDRLHHGAGTILDDVVSGIYAGIVLLLINYFWPLA